ncbi:MAG TPA: SRPBCC family protein [Gemmatimonadaceae bacterium]|nr:SRPBCC family protein [Gemmatimonadaceae bacterium]
MSDSIRLAQTIARPPAEAFALFTEGLGRWWPREYTWGQEALEAIGMEPRPGGLCFERGPHGFRCDWGRVVAWEPPARVAFTWQISPRREPVPDPARASRVEVRFEAVGDAATRVTLVHDGFEWHGEGAAEYRAALASPEGWPFILERFARHEQS